MGFLKRDNPDAPLNMTKAIVSLWFRIPSETWAAAAADWDANHSLGDTSEHGKNGVMLGVIPFITWGPQQTDTYYQTEFVAVLCDHTFNDAFGNPTIYRSTSGYAIPTSNDTPTQPSFIGVRGGGPNAGSLVVHLQTGDNPAGSNMNIRLTACAYSDSQSSGAPPVDMTLTDATFTISGVKDYFGNSNQWGDGDGIPTDKQQPSIGTSTAWHHVILSWDLTNGSAIHATDDFSQTIEQVTDSYSMLWCALNDVNKNGEDLPAIWLGMNGTNTPVDPNAMLCSKCNGYAFYNFSDPDGVLSLASPSVPSNPICIPGPASLSRDGGTTIEPVYKVEMADLQIFTDRSLNTSNLANRRLFVSDNVANNGRPVDPAVAQLALGKEPEVLLRGNGFITGTNLGTAGDFTVTGTVSAFDTPPMLGS